MLSMSSLCFWDAMAKDDAVLTLNFEPALFVPHRRLLVMTQGYMTLTSGFGAVRDLQNFLEKEIKQYGDC